LKAADIAKFLDAHNAVRKCYGVPDLVWDSQLEKDSAAYAALCKINPLTHSYATGVGENLATWMTTASMTTTNFPPKSLDYHVINQWYDEERFYKCPTNVCNTTNGQMCGHLTQVVWRDTTKVGCGVAKCLKGSFNVQNAVCRYSPQGNMNGNSPLETSKKTTTLCPTYPTKIGPISPTAPFNPVTAPVVATPVTTPVIAPVSAPVATPVAAPVAVPTDPNAVWWKNCRANYWTGVSPNQKKVSPEPLCAWAPWVSGSTVYCNPDPAVKYASSWPVSNIGTTECPAGKAGTSYVNSEESADDVGGLPMGAWIGIAIGIAVFIIIAIVAIIIIKKKKNNEHV
jgi:hypothetical protein